MRWLKEAVGPDVVPDWLWKEPCGVNGGGANEPCCCAGAAVGWNGAGEAE